MIQLHYTTRRWISRIAFLLLCLLPTVVVIGYAAVGQFSSATAQYEQALTQRLGVAVEIDQIAFPKPNTTILTGVKFSELGTNQPVANARIIEVVEREGVLYLIVSQPTVQGDKLKHWWKIVQQVMKLQQRPEQPAIRLVVNDLTIAAPGGKLTLVDFLGRIESTEHGVVAAADFRVAGMPLKEKITLRVSNRYENSQAESNLQLNTASGSVPCSLFSSIVPSLTRLDEAATFQGRIWATRIEEQWSGEISGTLREVNLDTLITDQFPHKLSGIADISKLGLKFKNNRVYEARGELKVTASGYIGRNFILAAVEHLGLSTTITTNESQSQLPYKKLAFAFNLTPQGVSLFGRCSEADETVILTTATGPILRQATDQPRPTLSLIRTLIPHTDVQIPASKEANRLLPHLPLPSYMELGKPRIKMKLRSTDGE